MPVKKRGAATKSVQATFTINVPAVLQIQQKDPSWVDGPRLPEWERVTAKLFGISIERLRKSSVSKTIDSCGEPPRLDYTDVDEAF